MFKEKLKGSGISEMFFKALENIRKHTRLKIAAILVLIFIFIISFAINVFMSSKTNGDGFISFGQSDFALASYSFDNGVYTSTSDDGNIYFPPVNLYIYSVTLYFDEPIENTDITIYTSNENHGYNEETAAHKNGNEKTVTVIVDEFVQSMRLDIGSRANQSFRLVNVNINDPDIISVGKNIEIYTILIYHVALFAVMLYLLGVFVLNIRLINILPFVLFCSGFVFILAVTPFSFPDPIYHYSSALKTSNYILFNRNNPLEVFSEHYAVNSFTVHRNTIAGYEYIVKNFNNLQIDNNVLSIMNTGNKYFVQYLVPAAGLAIARMFNLNFVMTYFLGECFNLAFYCSMIYFSTKALEKYTVTIYAVSVLPMALQQAGSYSYDVFINGFSIFIVSYIISIIIYRKEVTRKRFIILLAAGMLLAPAKTIYTLLVFLIFAIPKECYKNRKDYRIKNAVIIASCVAFVFVFNFLSISDMAAGDGVATNWEGGINYTLKDVISNPLNALQIYINSIEANWEYWLDTSIGSSLSGLTMPVSYRIITLYKILMIVSVFLSVNEKTVVNAKTKIFLFIASLGIFCLVLLSMMIDHTSNTRTVILGVQGRYFIPIILPLLLILQNKILSYKKNYEKALCFIITAMLIPTTQNIINYTLLN